MAKMLSLALSFTLISLGEGYTLLPDYAEGLVFRNKAHLSPRLF